MSTAEGPLKHQPKKGRKLNVRLVKAYKQQAILGIHVTSLFSKIKNYPSL